MTPDDSVAVGTAPVERADGRDLVDRSNGRDLVERADGRDLVERADGRNLVERADDRNLVERAIHELVDSSPACPRLVRKWPGSAQIYAFDHLSRYGLDELVRMPPASFWAVIRPHVAFAPIS